MPTSKHEHLLSSRPNQIFLNSGSWWPPVVISDIDLSDHRLSDGSIDLVARLLSMVDIGQLQNSFTGREHVQWTGSALKDSISNHFTAPISLHGETVKLEKVFNARNLKRIGGIEIEWTKNLADHLSFDDHHQKVAIFHHASFLECHRQR